MGDDVRCHPISTTVCCVILNYSMYNAGVIRAFCLLGTEEFVAGQIMFSYLSFSNSVFTLIIRYLSFRGLSLH